MQAILDLMGAIFGWLFVDMDGAELVYENGAIVEFINFLLSVPLLTIPIGFGLVVSVIAFYKKVRHA